MTSLFPLQYQRPTAPECKNPSWSVEHIWNMFDMFIFCRGSGCSKDRTAADYGEVGRGSNDWFGLHASGLSIMLTTNETSKGTWGNKRHI